MTRFVARENEAQWLKGPYLQLGLPFRPGNRGRGYFSAFQTEHPGFIHQELAWERLRTGGVHAPGNTLVATGTGSGMVMTPTGVITDRREATRKQPPDILLTNYKMLDLLLLRISVSEGLLQLRLPSSSDSEPTARIY